MTDFVHLHLHTEYSLLDGACRIDRLFDRAKDLGQTAVAITDHGVMFGVVDFYKAAKKAGVKPIIGCELYVAPRTRFDKSYELDSDNYHLVALCKNETGYKNLIKLCTAGSMEGFYHKPRIDFDILSQHSEGLILLSACLAGEVQQLLLRDNYDGARRAALKYKNLMGDGNYYLEIQDHGISEQHTINPLLIKLSKELKIPIVATNDTHYLRREDSKMHDVLLCIQTGKTLDDDNRMRFTGEEFYLKSGDEMAQLFAYLPEAIANTRKIADACNFEFEFGHYKVPHFDLPEGYNSISDFFKAKCVEGFQKHYPQAPPSYMERLNYEISVIDKMGYVEYYLIVADYISFARNHGIPVGPGRGSGAGSVAAYCLGITQADPMKYNLVFERFLNPERVSMPDFDCDFCPNRRQEVIDYVSEKYGHDHVAQIVTFGTMAARGAVRDVGRVLGMPYAEVDLVAKLIPQELKMTLTKALEVAPELKKYYVDDPRVKTLIDMAIKIEGMPRNISTHAAGVIVAPQPLVEYVPLINGEQGVAIQFDMITAEELGLLKFDFLGLRNLTIIDDAVKLVNAGGHKLDIDNLDYEDAAVFEMIAKGNTSGVFQMESGGMTGVAVSVKPKSIEDVTTIIALFRPGPMASIPKYIECVSHPEKIVYKHPLLEQTLSVTYGCTVYQEQVMEIFRVLAGYSLGRADLVRRAMSKKKFDVLASERENFVFGNAKENIRGCVATGVDEKTANSIFDELLDFANYAFPKAHALCYAIVAYQTAYLKYHYPKEYLAALLTSVLGQTSKIQEYIAQCKSMDVKVLPPDINESFANFSVSGDHIRFGMGAVKNVGIGLIDHLVQERVNGGSFTDFTDFCDRMSKYELNKRALESLIKCGAFDGLHVTRAYLMSVYVSVLDASSNDKKKNIEGQFSLFEAFGSKPKPSNESNMLQEYPKKELLAMERETTGLYLSGHPLEAMAPLCQMVGAVPISKLLSAVEDDNQSLTDGNYVTIAGVIGSVKMKLTKNQKNMAYITIEDLSATMEMLAFERALLMAGSYFQTDSAVICYGRISAREDEEPKLICDEIYPLLPEYAAGYRKIRADNAKYQKNTQYKPKPRTLYIKVPSQDFPPLDAAIEIMRDYPGDCRVQIYFSEENRRVGWNRTVEDNMEMLTRLEQLLGTENIVMKQEK